VNCRSALAFFSNAGSFKADFFVSILPVSALICADFGLMYHFVFDSQAYLGYSFSSPQGGHAKLFENQALLRNEALLSCLQARHFWELRPSADLGDPEEIGDRVI
jgi:hypothetical protein